MPEMALLARVELHTSAKKHSTPSFIFSSATDLRDGEGVLEQPFSFSVTYNKAAEQWRRRKCAVLQQVYNQCGSFCFGIYVGTSGDVFS